MPGLKRLGIQSQMILLVLAVRLVWPGDFHPVAPQQTIGQLWEPHGGGRAWDLHHPPSAVVGPPPLTRLWPRRRPATLSEELVQPFCNRPFPRP